MAGYNHKHAPIACRVNERRGWGGTFGDVIYLLPREWVDERLLARNDVPTGAMLVRFRANGAYRSTGTYDTYSRYDLTPLETAKKEQTAMSSNLPDTLPGLRARAMKFMAKRSNPDVHIDALAEAKFFDYSTNYTDAISILREYIKQNGGCKTDEALQFMGFTTEKWVEVTLTNRELLAQDPKNFRYSMDHDQSRTLDNYRNGLNLIPYDTTLVVFKRERVEV